MLKLDAQRMGLNGFTSSSWDEVTVQDSEATLHGTVTIPDGQVIPMTVKLVQEKGVWRVLSFTDHAPRPETPQGARDSFVPHGD
jgi:hypothetical protein